MNTGSHYKLKEFIPWTRSKIYIMLVISIIPVILYKFFDWEWLAIPWAPVAIVGTAAAFIAGFRNTQTYNRMWEARQIWGGIINSSRSFGVLVKDGIGSKGMIYRHLAWLTALRFQLRESKSWENVKTKAYNLEYLKLYTVPEWEGNMWDELQQYLSHEEMEVLRHVHNKPSQILALQSAHLKELRDHGHLSEYAFLHLQERLKDLFELQGKCERIKNFPYPRQFASINLYFTYLLCALLPLGFLGELRKLGEDSIWLVVPLSLVVGWIFLVLEQIGESTENPFEGGANDIPMAQISRNIEIDLREMLGEVDIPPVIVPQNNIVL
ncbi:bestrophin family protein [Leadbetterella byssophila]|uniref:bestrophin family protein n=1 Tax=Leadbetterella byssophila TaxID=316068 RepID=UPI0039A07673